MMRIQEAATAMRGQAGATQAKFSAVSTDSRSIRPGELFIALRGERYDGHGFVREVLAQGAAAAVVDAAWAASNNDQSLSLIVVDDTKVALGDLATYWRRRFPIPLIAVVGSNGKTTVKEMIAAILAAEYGVKHRLATIGNLNNEIGVPLMLLRLRNHHRAAVIELGMNHPGETAVLAAMVKPTIALINNAQREHQEFMATVAAVAAEHSTVIDALKTQGTVVINADDAYATDWRQAAAERRVLDFGLNEQAAVNATWTPDPTGALMHVRTPEGQTEILLSTAGEHNVRNALGAVAAALAAGVGLAAVTHGLTAFRPVKGRLQVKAGIHGATLIDDTYNANPDSMRVAIDVLAVRPGKRILVMGDMGEVGAQADLYHKEIGSYAQKQGIDLLLALGDMSLVASRSFGADGRHFSTLESLLETLRSALDEHTAVLVKGSRFMRMERVIDALLAEAENKGSPNHVA